MLIAVHRPLVPPTKVYVEGNNKRPRPALQGISTLGGGYCHDPFPRLSLIHSSPTLPCQAYPSDPVQDPSDGTLSHPNLWPKPQLELPATSSETYQPSKIMWSSHDNHTIMHHPCHLVGQPLSQWTWALRVPTLLLCNLFLSYCILMLLFLLCSGPLLTCAHS